MALEPNRRRSPQDRQTPFVRADEGRSTLVDPRHQALADRFRNSSQAERVQDPRLNAAAKVLAHTNGMIDAAYGPDTAKAASSRAAALEKIAVALERGERFSAPETMQNLREQNRDPERSRSRSSEPER